MGLFNKYSAPQSIAYRNLLGREVANSLKMGRRTIKKYLDTNTQYKGNIFSSKELLV